MRQTVPPLNKLIIVVLVSVSCVGIDQITKGVAGQHLSDMRVISFLYDVIRLQYSENTGAFLSFGADLPENARFWAFVVFAAITLLGMVVFVLMSSHISKLSLIGISLIIGGGMGNLIDRIGNNGAVVDFMNIGIGGLRTGIFNSADIAISIGAVMLVLFYGRHEMPIKKTGS